MNRTQAIAFIMKNNNCSYAVAQHYVDYVLMLDE